MTDLNRADYRHWDVDSAAEYIQACVSEMLLVSVYGSCENGLAELGNLTLAGLMEMWLDNLHDDQHAGGDHEQEIEELTSLLAAIGQAGAAPDA